MVGFSACLKRMTPMVLAIETTDLLCSVAFQEDDRTLLEYNLELPMQHAAILGGRVQEGLRFLAGLQQPRSLNDVHLIAVAVGPGSFTGLRIGLSFAQGMAEGRKIPLVGVSNHQLLAARRLWRETDVYTIIEARRDEVYLAKHGVSPDLLTEIVDHRVVAKQDLPEQIPDGGHLICHKSLTLPEPVWDQMLTHRVRIFRQADYAANWLAVLGQEKFDRQGADDPETIEPMYVRPFAGVL
ncbi:MAG TPA: tRNA (adenosine(37)-N6)-threonylcarbamoyltransferase complex dimerization subunit type 1 TsaB [Caldithrix abyssi]|uniref:tRNA (Adenosine(37)-N6)-threonylcarbamoyltransferase complex dimerization subunit type 1 TsaB n=1 Tax=Caldithrix abyssi TaxID=187145 RepID=A0A7V5UFJ1_CALAY|nr:tRNA (adenosine(37)-N6)-threonylcarbamoyltransferase complex dimerization subunit type 1 TsaB [Caldithrix abyssi]